MNIALDVMGGDNAPHAPIQGAIKAIKSGLYNSKIVLVGDRSIIEKELNGLDLKNLTVLHAQDTITTDDSASKLIKEKPESSMVKGIRLVKDKAVDAFISAGNTGAQMATSLLALGRIPHVKRPALSAFFSGLSGGKILCDVGANPDARAEHLLQFAIMSSVYLDHIEGIKNPKIGLVNIGEEPTKGSDLYQEAHKLLSKELPNFVGNIESRNIFTCNADVLVCDGFVGNTIIKFAEGCISSFTEMIKEKIASKNRYKIGAQMLQPALEEIKNRYDYEEHGGTPLLGVDGISIVCHGASTSKSIMNSIVLAQKSINKNLIEDVSIGINDHLEALSES
jgi:glycerol-3-phosphate acyltransferase PlsX